MRILFVFHERNIGGGTRSAVTLIRELKDNGHDIMAVIPVYCGKTRKLLEQCNIRYKVVHFGWWMVPDYWNKALKVLFKCIFWLEKISAIRIAFIAKRFDADIIHSVSSVVDVGARTARACHIKHVWHFREFGDLDFHLRFLTDRADAIRFINDTDGMVVFISKALKDRYKGEIKEEKSVVIYNGIPKDYLIKKDSKREHDIVRFLIAGSLQRNKNQLLAIKAMRVLYKQGHTNIRLYIAGDTADTADSRQYKNELLAEASLLPAGMVIFAGSVSDMNKIRLQTDVELICSVSEAFGRCSIESMMASNPVIASRAGANPELIVPMANGLLFEDGNCEELADCMSYFISNPELINSFGDNAYQYAESKFLSDRNTAAVEKIYMDLLKRPS